MKKYKIINKFRFGTTLVLLSIVLSIILFSIIVDAKDTSKELSVPVVVESGDTLWELSRKYNNNSNDIRDYISKVIGLNKMKSANIKAGQMIYFPQ